MNEDIKKLKELFSTSERKDYLDSKSKTFWVDLDKLVARDQETVSGMIDNCWFPYPPVIPNYPGSPWFPDYESTTPYPYRPNTTTFPYFPPVEAEEVKEEPKIEKKDGNPKNSVGSTKFALSVVPTTVTAEVGLGMLEGARKYGRHNWREEGALASIYWDAANRHLIKWYEGEDIDPDSGLSHITKAICSLYVLRDAMIQGVMTDDRPPRSPDQWYEDLDAAVRFILEKYPDAKPAHTEKSNVED